MSPFPAPSYTGSIDLRYFLEPLSGPGPPVSYLERFPDELYSKAPDTHFMRFMYVLLGPTGIGWLTKELLLLRLQLEANGMMNAELDAFYGDPLSFSRGLTEQYNSDLAGLLSDDEWAAIRAQDEAYRSRATQYLQGARLGNTPTGMELVAKSGLGQEVDVVENYRALFDMHSDDRLGLPYCGSSFDLGEWIVRPRPMVSRTSVQTISFDPTITDGAFFITFNGRVTPSLPVSSTSVAVAAALSGLNTIGPGNVLVTGGPAPLSYIVTFTGILTNQDLLTLVVAGDPNNVLVDALGATKNVYVTATTGTIDASQEGAWISEADRHSMQIAIDYLRPVGTYPTFAPGHGVHGLQAWQGVFTSSEFTRVTRFVTGSPSILWPPLDNTNWIESSVEREAPGLMEIQGHYLGFHNVAAINAYTDTASPATEGFVSLPLLFPSQIPADSPLLPKYNSVHVGSFTPQITSLIPFFSQYQYADTVFSADHALANYPELMAITGQTDDGTSLIQYIYPTTYLGLQGVPTIRQDDTFWASMERSYGTDYLEIDLGSAQAVNFLTFEITRKPVDIQISYDLLDQLPHRYVPVVPDPDQLWDGAIFYDANEQSPWTHLEFHFGDGLNMLFTRYIRLGFSRRLDTTPGSFLFDPVTQTQTPWSIDVRNLRIGRNIAPALT